MPPRTLASLLLALSLLLTAPAGASTMPLQGVIRDNAAALVQSGSFAMTFTLYGSAGDEAALWQEAWPASGDCSAPEPPPGCVAVTNGTFAVQLGTLVPLAPELFEATAEVWIGIAVEGEPELPRRPLGTATRAYVAQRAAVAGSVDCTGCIPESALAFDLCGVAEACGGFGPVSSEDLPGDGLDEVSNGTLTNTYETAWPELAMEAVEMDQISLTTSTITVPSLGAVEAIEVSVDISHPDAGELLVELQPPTGGSLVLHNGGMAGVEDLVGSWDAGSSLPAGSLTALVGADAAGEWTLTVTDVTPGNAGTLNGWGLEFAAVRDDEVSATADLNLQGHQLLNARLQVATAPPLPCGPETQGAVYVDSGSGGLRICLGEAYVQVGTAPVCGDGVVAHPEGCDDGNDESGDGCSGECLAEHGFVCPGTPGACVSVCGDGVVAADEQCDHGGDTVEGCESDCKVTTGWVCASEPSVCALLGSCNTLADAGLTASGLYLLDVDGDGPLEPFEGWCDLTTDGGGWTLVESWDISLKDTYTTRDFVEDFPRNQDSHNWDDYRLSRARMLALINGATRVHTRCHRDWASSTQDYLFGDIQLVKSDGWVGQDLDVMVTNPQNVECKVRGYPCSGTSPTHWYHANIYHPTLGDNPFPGADTSGSWEDNFGWEGGPLNPAHLCHTSAGEIVWFVR